MLTISSVYDVKPTGDAEADRLRAQQYVYLCAACHDVLISISVKKELARLERNKERRHAREKAKGKHVPPTDPENAGSPSSTPAPSIEKPVGTTRKCANCGQMGHIKTNKKYHPNFAA